MLYVIPIFALVAKTSKLLKRQALLVHYIQIVLEDCILVLLTKYLDYGR